MCPLAIPSTCAAVHLWCCCCSLGISANFALTVLFGPNYSTANTEDSEEQRLKKCFRMLRQNSSLYLLCVLRKSRKGECLPPGLAQLAIDIDVTRAFQHRTVPMFCDCHILFISLSHVITKYLPSTIENGVLDMSC